MSDKERTIAKILVKQMSGSFTTGIKKTSSLASNQELVRNLLLIHEFESQNTT